ncbi:MAG: DegT/DnrJ/EryC1/StrS family aminotransferase [Candidatus Omnitrophica bacterium]|nr:DegT/DnrJ/EryC1/StrS family aminotransferase [Candidatus Omnitrophota bacterium]
MKVPFIDFTEQHQTIKKEIETGFKEVFRRGDFVLGKAAEEFEAQFAGYCDSKYGVGVNSGTDALYLAVSALDINLGDEVIIPPFTFIATALCISYTGAKPVFVDIEDETYNLDPKKIKQAITKKTKAIMPVHLYGQTADMDEINSIAKEYGIAVIEDAAQAHGARYKGKRSGALGEVACFSFYPTKGLGAYGDGGIVVTSNKDIYEEVKMLRDYGREGRYKHKVKGYNSRLDTLQAVVLSAKLKHLDKWNEQRSNHAAYYGKLLKGIKGVKVPVAKNDRTHVYQTFAIRVKNRDAVCAELQKRGIGVLIHYPIPIHLQEAYRELKHKKGDFPVSEALCEDVLSLPMFPHMTKKQIEFVCENIKELVKK